MLRQAFESSGAVRTIMREGEVTVAELSVDLWRVNLQDSATSYKEAVAQVSVEIESTMKVELELLEATSDEKTIDDPYLEIRRLVQQRSGRSKMEVLRCKASAIQKASGAPMKFLGEIDEKLVRVDSKLDAIQEVLLTM